MRTSEQINELATAFAAAQKEFANPERNRTVRVATKAGGEYSFRYSTLDCVMDMARPILSKHGLSITQPPTVRDGNVVVITRLMHSSGQWQEEEIPVIPESWTAQQIGSAITYLKRYAYCGMLGIASDEDDDGNGASGNQILSAKEREPLPACPECGKQTSVIVGKQEFGGGLVCFRKKEGCGHTWGTEEHPLSGKQEPTKQTAKKKSDKPLDPPSDPNEAASAYNGALTKILNFHGTDAEFATFKTKVFDWMTKAEGDGEISKEQADKLTQALGRIEDNRKASVAA